MTLLNCKIFIFLVSLVIVKSSELCASDENDSVDCSKQLWQDKEDEERGYCNVKYYKTDSEACDTMAFKEDLWNTADLGRVQIRPYLMNYMNLGYMRYTIFNVTFTDIRWNHMKFRFKPRDNITEYKNHCREISIGKAKPLKKTSNLFYDCFWSYQTPRYQNTTYYFDYEAEGPDGVARGKYIFIVPSIQMLAPENSEIQIPFLYLNVINSQKVDIHIVSPRFDMYKIEICQSVNKIKECKKDLTWVENGEDEVIHYGYLMPASGSYFVQMTFLSNCTDQACKSIQLGPTIENESSVIVYTILFVILFSIIFWFLVIICCLYGGQSKKVRPTVVIIHPQGNKMEAAVASLRRYLESELKWKIMSKSDIKQTIHSTPYLWCMEAFKQADIILYIVNPFPNDQISVEYVDSGIYRNVDQTLRKIVASGDLRCPIVNVVFERYASNQVPAELIHMKTFKLFKDWNKLLRFIMHYSIWDTLKYNLPKLNASELGKDLQLRFYPLK